MILFTKLKMGDNGAFAHLYQQYAADLRAYASNKVDSLEEAHDLIHDLFVHLWERRAELEIRQSVRGYLFGSLNRRILNLYRKNNYRSSYAQQIRKMEEAFHLAPDCYVEAKDLQEVINRTVASMPRKMQEIYLLSRESYLSNQQIARKLNISEQTVKNQLTTSRAMLRKAIRYLLLLLLLQLSVRLLVLKTYGRLHRLPVAGSESSALDSPVDFFTSPHPASGTGIRI